MLKGFRDFILRGNVIELATAVIIGAAFTNIVTAISEKVINPLIAAIGSADTPAVLIPLREGRPEAVIDLGAVLSATINFLIVAAIVYFLIIAPMNKVNQLRKKGVEEDIPPSSEDLLTEIRDLLQANAESTQANQAAQAALVQQLAQVQAARQPVPAQQQVPQQAPPQQQVPPQQAGYGQPPVPPQGGDQPRH